MNKALLISIQPQHAINILNGKKTLELRSWIPKGYKGWVYVYVSKGLGKTKYHHLYNLTEYNNGETLFSITHHNKHSLVPDGFLNSKVVFRFWFDEYDVIEVDSEQHRSIVKETCLSLDEIIKYCRGKTLYAWHIKDLEIFDKPKELSEFYKNDSKWSVHYYIWSITDCILLEKYTLTKAPQKMVWVYVNER